MKSSAANKFLANAGFPGLSVSKAEGVWYLIGDDGVVSLNVERCLHVVRAADLTEEVLTWKLVELTK